MLARCARVAPACMRAPSCSPYCTASRLSVCTTLMPPFKGSDRLPLAPFMVTSSPVMVAVTPWGRSTGALATLLMLSSRHDAQHFAALADRAGLAVRHHAARRRDDHGAHAAEYLRQLVLATINAQPRAADALEAVDHGSP